MKIVREGKEFELTSQELLQAYKEQESIFDLLNIEHNLENHVSLEEYARLKDNKDFLEAAAKLLRENQDDKNMGYDTALSQAIYDTARDYSLLVQQVNLVIENRFEENMWTDIFLVDAGKPVSKELFVEAVQSFLMTEAGRKALSDTGSSFNWGDAEFYIQDDFWQQFGIYPYDYEFNPEDIGLEPVRDVEPITIRVNQEEVLLPEGYFEKNRKPSLADQIAGAAPRAGQVADRDGDRCPAGPAGR